MEKAGRALNGRNKVWLYMFLCWSTGLFLCVPSVSHGQSAAQVLKAYEGLPAKEREAKLMEGAKREGEVVYYGTIAIDHSKRLLDAFKKRYPFLKTLYYRSGNVDLYNKIRTEARANRHAVDVIDLQAGETYTVVKDGLVDPYFSPSREGIMKEFMDERGYWTAMFHLPMALGYNTAYVKEDEAPRSYEDLLDPKWKRRMSLDTDDGDMMGALIEYWGKEKGIAYAKRLAENEPSMRRGHTFQAQILAAGEIHVAPWLFGYRPLTMMRNGAPLQIVLLEPVISAANFMLLAKNAPHPHSAALFIDWVLSRDGGMRIFAEELGRNAPRLEASYKDKFPELRASKYLVVDPGKFGPKYAEYTAFYCSTFKHC